VGDVFVDLEKAIRCGEKGLQYLFWVCGARCAGRTEYEKAMALNRERRKRDLNGWWTNPAAPGSEPEDARVSLRGPTSPETLKRLMGMYATREDEMTECCGGGNGRCIRLTSKVFERAWRIIAEDRGSVLWIRERDALEASRVAMAYLEHA